MGVRCFQVINNKEYVFFWFLLFPILLFAGLIWCWHQPKEEFFLSRESGFYKEPFTLYIDGPSTSDIYYTLDGSEPDEKSLKYTSKGITIDNLKKYCLAENHNISGGFYSFEAGSAQDISHYRTEFGSYDTACIIRAACYYNNQRTDLFGFYKIGEPKTINSNYTVSIIISPENLLDQEKGIYVLGHSFDVFRKNNENWLDIPWRWWEGNFRGKGKEFERLAYVSIFDEEGRCIDQNNCGIRIHGNVSRGFAQKGFNIYYRKKYGCGYVNAGLFGYQKLSRITLDSSSSDDTKTQDKLVAELSNNLNFGVMDYIPAAVYINGEYWGQYNVTEKYDASFLSEKYSVNKDNIVVIKNRQLEVGENPDYNEYIEEFEYFSTCDYTIDNNFSLLCEKYDLNSIIDYYAVNIYIDNSSGDWPASNLAIWKTRYIENSEFGDAKWRYLLFDVNAPDIMFDPDRDTIDYLLECDTFFSNLWENDTFRNSVLDRLIYLSINNFSSENIKKIFNNVDVREIKRSYDRFYDGNFDSVLERINSVNSFYEKRNETIGRIVAIYRQ